MYYNFNIIVYTFFLLIIETVLDPELVQPTTSIVPKIKTPPHTRRRNSTKIQQPISPPVFEGPAISNVTARLGESTFLYCTVQNLQQRPVSYLLFIHHYPQRLQRIKKKSINQSD